MKIEDIIPDGASSQTTTFMELALAKLTEVKTIEDCDIGGLHILATCYEMYIQLAREVFRTGAIVKDRKGNVSPNPLSIEMLKYMDKVLTFSKDYGLTVKSRDLIKSMTPAVSQDNILAQFYASQNAADIDEEEDDGLNI